MDSYFNTTHSTRQELGKYEEKAVSQEVQILKWFRGSLRLSGRQQYSPNEVRIWCFAATSRPPITSIRRAMTNLTNTGDMEKTDKQVKGPYGRPEYQWRLAEKHQQLRLL